MMLILGPKLLEDLGLSDLPESDRHSLLDAIVQDLELRVGQRIADSLDETDLDEFCKVNAQGNDEKARAWLGEKAPNYQAIVESEYHQLVDEVRRRTPEIRFVAGLPN